MKYGTLLLLLLCIGCSSSKVVYDYDSTTDFSEYKTFNFFEDVGKGLTALDVKRVTHEVKLALEAKGMQLSETPAMYVNIFAEERESLNRNTIGVGIGSGGANVGFGISGGIPIESRKINQQLTIDFVESKNNQLIWQGIATADLREKITPEQKIVYYQKIIEKVLDKYPPKDIE
ncbi:DUF4136 domain-containing protein [Tenacibaculum tangerinum]|uniref:DUF4136 domain-containing protein n=1 Tax=Tenacibaculum tangerinum TaxID=3038772 RepID=A0ABY8L1S5_9FLAO|nr:DUF4136 domain-containing protein [Tenacibaculum tangerinum]WGH75402.1 DUF4136 domain-containing protein [Tenacibaculum tangerinum]